MSIIEKISEAILAGRDAPKGASPYEIVLGLRRAQRVCRRKTFESTDETKWRRRLVEFERKEIEVLDWIRRRKKAAA